MSGQSWTLSFLENNLVFVLDTENAILILNTLIESKLRPQKKLYCCFVDLRKAFDSVDHQLLWHKLTQLSMSSKLLRLLMNIYSKGQSCVKVNGQLTNTFKCNIDVWQGCPLSPILFVLYTHDLMQGNRPEELHIALNKLEAYCSQWKLTVNKEKDKDISIWKLTIKGCVIEIQKHYP